MSSLGQFTLRDFALDELIQDHLEGFQDDGSSHQAVCHWLASDLWDLLWPHLSKRPWDAWKVDCGRCIDLRLDEIPRVIQEPGQPMRLEHPPRYLISLVEEVRPGEYEPAPWRESSVRELGDRIRKWLDEAREEASASLPAP